MEEFNLDADQNGSSEQGIDVVQTDDLNPDAISLRQHGIAHSNFNVTIDIKPQGSKSKLIWIIKRVQFFSSFFFHLIFTGLQNEVSEVGDVDVKASAYDQYLLIVNRWLPMVTKWVQGLQKFQGEYVERHDAWPEVPKECDNFLM